MHSEPTISDEMRTAMATLAEGSAGALQVLTRVPPAVPGQVLGPTGKFPEGKLTENDQGEVVFGIGVYNGKVILNFGAPLQNVGMSATQARQIAASLLKCADALQAVRVAPRRARRRAARAEKRGA